MSEVFLDKSDCQAPPRQALAFHCTEAFCVGACPACGACALGGYGLAGGGAGPWQACNECDWFAKDPEPL